MLCSKLLSCITSLDICIQCTCMCNEKLSSCSRYSNQGVIWFVVAGWRYLLHLQEVCSAVLAEIASVSQGFIRQCANVNKSVRLEHKTSLPYLVLSINTSGYLLRAGDCSLIYWVTCIFPKLNPLYWELWSGRLCPGALTTHWLTHVAGSDRNDRGILFNTLWEMLQCILQSCWETDSETVCN